MKRWALRIVLLLVLGCVTTVAVAWGAAVWGRGMPGFDGAPISADRAIEIWHALKPDEWRLHWSGYVEGFESHRAAVDEVVVLAAEETTERFGVVSAYEYGWAGRALGLRVHADRLGNNFSEPVYTQSYGLSSIEWAGIDSWRALPARPIWPGFLINTLFYGVIWFGIFFGSGSARRALRRRFLRRGGRCPKCAYDLRSEFDAGCSECGWNRPEDEA